ncbi:hypothetical protein NADFUDRAFT_79749 [Nadsonia fulvescens var. elongata DSM 6958]|uniref:Myosin-2 n=1 Tax=Nadsonia fulvescens var. elongata DSM 6958 TaxID=857566 RepID=A0A1E3PG47_9ASCO|nr:hypothetical protein NADFUDRAFT_79749 [Nadsonia fulvescens var. elongata DSM 6958]
MPPKYESGTRCWLPDDKESWIGVEVISKTISGEKVTLTLKYENGDTLPFETTITKLEREDSTLPQLRNPPILESTEDLTSLSYLNEPAVLNAIKMRYAQLSIYTYSGIVLIATNPFQRIDNLYTPDIIQAYAGKQRGELEPHLFAIAEDAYRRMVRDNKNQTIVVSGESGAGKTVSAKYIMRYFATVEKVTDQLVVKATGDDRPHTERQILATNPIMEAFGNAKTIRNDNSSRFGKYLEIMFNKKVEIIGAKIRTYLLERSRLVFQPPSERNYHIFYQLISGSSDEEKKKLGLLPVMEYNYLKQGGDPVIQGVNDAEEFQATKNALRIVGIDDITQSRIFELLSALLMIGNIEISTGRIDASLSSDEPSLARVCALLKIDPVLFAKWIVKKQITTRNEKIISSLNKQQATVVRDSVAKYIYTSLFDWLVSRINRDLCAETVIEQVNTFIGVLDIYGFEHFKRNSFEQFCINYANEKLQQEFNQHVFKLEQDEYIQEEIEWNFIDFSDNQPCISLIEAKMGILSLLDEEARLPGGSDESWINKLYQNFDTTPHKFFKKPRFGKTSFTVNHYAMDVNYESEGFVEKNRDSVPEEHMNLLMSSKNDFLKIVLEDAQIMAQTLAPHGSSLTVATSAKTRVINRKPTLGSIFKSSLIELMNTINSTNVHYIRCIKPNENKEAWTFEAPMVLSQLRACGVLETIRISCAGFPTRWTYEEFASRYYMLLNSNQWSNEVRDVCDQILKQSIINYDSTGALDSYQLGKTKIFFRAGMLAHLEKLRSDRLNSCAIVVQKNARRMIERNRYMKIRDSIVAVQSLFRGHITRLWARKFLETKSATLIQAQWRGYSARKTYQKSREGIIKLQAIIRGKSLRNNILQTRDRNAAVTIQRAWRSYSAKRKYKSELRKVVIVQSCVRRFSAKKQLDQLRVEAKSVNNLKEVQYHLENKVVELTQNLAARTKEKKALTIDIEGLRSKVDQWMSKNKQTEVINREMESRLSSIQALHHTHISEIDAKFNLLKCDFDSTSEILNQLRDENEQLKATIETKDGELEASRGFLENEKEHNEEHALTIKKLESEVEKLKNQVLNMDTSKSNFNGSASITSIARSTAAAMVVGGHNIHHNQATNGFINGASKRINSKRHSITGPLHDGEKDNSSYNPRPVSVIGVPSATSLNHSIRQLEYYEAEEDSSFDNSQGINAEMERILDDGKLLLSEVIQGLIINLKYPKTSGTEEVSPKDVLFPAHIINLIISELWRLGYVKESERFLGDVMQAIQNNVMGFNGEDIINPGAFWISNVHEILSFVSLAEENMLDNESLLSEMGEYEFGQYGRLLALVKMDLEHLEFNIYHAWMKELKTLMDKMIIPAVIVSQALPGFITSEGSRFPKMPQIFSREPLTFTMDDMLSLLNKVYKAMRTYFLEPDFMRQPIMELLKLVGVKAFNDLMMRRNFLSWKRGLQISYNITRIDEWCKVHNIAEGVIRLEHLVQSAKLLQLKKATMEDIEIIYDVCWTLTPTQIQRLLNQYLLADYEEVTTPEILAAVAERVKTDHNNTLLLESTSLDDSGPFELMEPRLLSKLETYIPAWVQVPKVRDFVELSALVNSQNTAAVQQLHLQESYGEYQTYDDDESMYEIEETGEDYN